MIIAHHVHLPFLYLNEKIFMLSMERECNSRHVAIPLEGGDAAQVCKVWREQHHFKRSSNFRCINKRNPRNPSFLLPSPSSLSGLCSPIPLKPRFRPTLRFLFSSYSGRPLSDSFSNFEPEDACVEDVVRRSWSKCRCRSISPPCYLSACQVGGRPAQPLLPRASQQLRLWAAWRVGDDDHKSESDRFALFE